MLTLSRKYAQSVILQIGGQTVRVTVVEMSHGKVRLGFEADRAVRIFREELLDGRRGRPQEARS